MQISITPKKLSGSIEAVSSKSYAHRVFIAAALADAPTDVHINVSSEDIEATLRCIKALGAKTEKTENGFIIYPIDVPNENAVTFKYLSPDGKPTQSAHPARFSPDDQYSQERVTLKKRFGLLPTQKPDIKL